MWRVQIQCHFLLMIRFSFIDMIRQFNIANFNNSQTTFAKTGLIKKNSNNNDKILELYDGRTINNVNGKSSEFGFAKTDYNMSSFGTKTITQQKVQETPTIDLIECSFLLNSLKIFSTKGINDIINCTIENLENIYEEIYSRLLKPLYTTFLIIISLLIILKSKSDPAFNLNKLKVYLFGFIFVIFLESSSKFISLNLIQNLLFLILPFFLTLTIYLYFIITLRVIKK